jgi:hypothetical protein
VPSVELLSVTRLADTPHASPAPHELCDHDGKASGRLVLEDGGIRLEVVCSCGRMVAFLGRIEYRGGRGRGRGRARRRRTSNRRWRRSRALLFSARHGHAVKARASVGES